MSPSSWTTLLWPTLDPPIAALHTAIAMPGSQEDILKPEDHRADQVLQRGHQAAAWAVQAASAASFFSRSSLFWLSYKNVFPLGIPGPIKI